MKANWFLRVGSFVVGVVVGMVVFRGRAEPKSASPTPEYANPAVVAAEPRLAPSPSPLRAASPPQNPPPVGTRLRALVELNGCLRNRIHVPLIEFAGVEKLNPDFLALYEVSENEEAQLEAALARAKRQVAQLEAKVAVITPGADGEFNISIPPFPEAGGAVFDEFCRSVRAVLGEERYASYRASGEETDSSSLSGFGVGETSIVLKGVGASNDWQYSMGTEGLTNGTFKKVVVIGRLALPEWYPELARRMAADGLLPLPAEP